MEPPKASIQLIVFGERNRSDIAGVLADVAKSGFQNIEAGNLFEMCGEGEVRRLLAENSLGISGAHFGYGDYADAARLASHIEYARAMGIRNMMCSGVAEAGSAAGYKESARLFDAVGRRLADEGIRFHYHNHAWEFKDLGGLNGMEVLTTDTDPKFVGFNIDVFWVYYAQQDPAAFIRQHAGRAGYFHFKDGRRVVDALGKITPEFLELGRGEVDLKSAMAAAREAGAQWIVAEQDSTTLPHLESATISRSYMRQELGV
ncbi:MAG TPA: sugar phosphate isomerase/epimerase [Chthonomonadales bacterium]|nr:sugar phosphate isomerase/epimerase [Chthonomonadales bacterium]